MTEGGKRREHGGQQCIYTETEERDRQKVRHQETHRKLAGSIEKHQREGGKHARAPHLTCHPDLPRSTSFRFFLAHAKHPRLVHIFCITLAPSWFQLLCAFILLVLVLMLALATFFRLTRSCSLLSGRFHVIRHSTATHLRNPPFCDLVVVAKGVSLSYLLSLLNCCPSFPAALNGPPPTLES